MKFLPFHNDGVLVFRLFRHTREVDSIANFFSSGYWEKLDVDRNVFSLYERHGMLDFTKSDLIFWELNKGSVSDYIIEQAHLISKSADDALWRIATNLVDYNQLLEIEPYGMSTQLRRSILAFATKVVPVNVK
jgi:hypothetical protein